MCPPGCHHNGFMVTPKLGHRMYGYTLWERIALWSHQSAQTASSEPCIVQIVNVLHRLSPPNPKECSNCMSTMHDAYLIFVLLNNLKLHYSFSDGAWKLVNNENNLCDHMNSVNC